MKQTPARKLYQRIADDLAAAIGDGRYPPGTRLPAERDLAEERGVSRPTIREAMIALEIRGLVEARQGSGIYVTNAPASAGSGPELDVGAFELLEARILVEGEAAALAARTIGDETVAALQALLPEMASPHHGANALDADKKFHMLIADATGNSLVRSLIESLWTVRERSPLCRHMFEQARREGIAPRAAEHRLIVDALAAHDPHRAREAMHAHLRRVVDDVLAATELEVMQRAQAEVDAQRRRVAARTG